MTQKNQFMQSFQYSEEKTIETYKSYMQDGRKGEIRADTKKAISKDITEEHPTGSSISWRHQQSGKFRQRNPHGGHTTKCQQGARCSETLVTHLLDEQRDDFMMTDRCVDRGKEGGQPTIGATPVEPEGKSWRPKHSRINQDVPKPASIQNVLWPFPPLKNKCINKLQKDSSLFRE